MQSEIDRIKWYHEFDFPDGLKSRSNTPDIGFHRALWTFIERNLDTIDFEGKRVLDIGCWDGYWSFYAERRGASSVLATDDISQRWAAGEGLLMAKRLFRSKVEIDQERSVYDLASLGQKFDVILCMGVYYHLYDPLYAFSQIRHCCNSDTVVVIEGDVGKGLDSGTGKYCFGDQSKSVFLPSIELLDGMLASAYLKPIRTDYFSGAHTSSLKRRIEIRLAKERQLHMDRSLVIARPIEGRNDAHPLKPPFGLHEFDDRW
jgi:tRNA (mo5U34)-methyltransferase